MSTVLTNNFTELATGDTVPAKYLVHGSAKAWANLNGQGTIALRDSFGISSVVDEGTGDYTFNYTNAMANANYKGQANVSGQTSIPVAANFDSYASGNYRLSSVIVGTGRADIGNIFSSVMGDLA